ncbi:ATP-binding cassette subfamily C protein CydD [Rhizobium sp. PP-WC-2G-219]|nr:ATP-binding cassette subfamily C protein CydD [Rhizobium sp. PP-WC-2G-219]
MSDRARDSDPACERRWMNGLRQRGGFALRLAITLPLVSGLLLIAQAYILASLLQKVIIDHATLQQVVPMVLLFGGVYLARIGLGFGAEQAASAAAERIKFDLRKSLNDFLLDQKPRWTEHRSSGILSAAIVDQTEALDGYFARFLPAMVQAALLPLVFAVSILPVDWVVALLFLVTAPLIPLFMALVGWGAQAETDRQAEAFSRLSGLFADRLRGIVTLKIFGRATRETAGVLEASHDLRLRTLRVLKVAFLSSAVLEFFAALGVAGVALYVGLSYLGFVDVRWTPLSLRSGLFCLLMAPEVYQPLRLLAAHYHDKQSAKAAISEISRHFEEMTDAVSKTRLPRSLPASAMPSHNGAGVDLSIRGLRLNTTASNRTLLSEAGLTLPAGMHAALIGESGIGKSTLLEAIAGLHPFEGTIRIGAARLEDIDEQALRVGLAFLGQNPVLFKGTIADNIRFGRSDATDLDIQTAAACAAVVEFTSRLPDGLDTLIGENGRGLSGGEAHRVALARIFLRNPSVILLDEPTAHLDPATEGRVLDALAIFAKGRTLLIATHSEAVAQRFSRIYRIADRAILPAFSACPPVKPMLRGHAA